MLNTQLYAITSNKQKIIIRLDRTLIEPEKLEQFLDYLILQSIQHKTQLSEKVANELLIEINNAIWNQQKSLFEL